jgi:hypothetical protein
MIDTKAHSSVHVFWLMDNTAELLDRNSGDIMLQQGCYFRNIGDCLWNREAISSAKDIARSDLLEIGCSKKALSKSSTNIPSKMHQLAIN